MRATHGEPKAILGFRSLPDKIVLDLDDLMLEVFQSKYKLGRDHWLTWLLRVEELLSIRFSSAVITANYICRIS